MFNECTKFLLLFFRSLKSDDQIKERSLCSAFTVYYILCSTRLFTNYCMKNVFEMNKEKKLEILISKKASY